MNATTESRMDDQISNASTDADEATPEGADVDADAVDEADEAVESDAPSELDSDDLFHLLKSERRRRAIKYLLDADDEPVRMRTLAEAVAAEEYDTTVEALRSDERQRVYITLYQSHLPQLDDAGVIDYNQSRGRITTNPLIHEFEEYLGDSEDEDGGSVADAFSPALAGFGGGGTATLIALQVLGGMATAVMGVMSVVFLAAAWGLRNR